jgi:hypothetical protein
MSSPEAETTPQTGTPEQCFTVYRNLISQFRDAVYPNGLPSHFDINVVCGHLLRSKPIPYSRPKFRWTEHVVWMSVRSDLVAICDWKRERAHWNFATRAEVAAFRRRIPTPEIALALSILSFARALVYKGSRDGHIALPDWSKSGAGLDWLLDDPESRVLPQFWQGFISSPEDIKHGNSKAVNQAFEDMNTAFRAANSAPKDTTDQEGSKEEEEFFTSVPFKKSRSPELQIPSIPLPPASVSASMASDQTFDPLPTNEKTPRATQATPQPLQEGPVGMGGDLLELKAMRRTMRRLENNFKGYMSRMNDTDARAVKSSRHLTELASLRTQNEALLTDNTNLEKRNEAVEDENERLKRELEDFKKLKDDYNKLEAEKEGLESALETQRDEVKRLNESIETRKKQRGTATTIENNTLVSSPAASGPPQTPTKTQTPNPAQASTSAHPITTNQHPQHQSAYHMPPYNPWYPYPPMMQPHCTHFPPASASHGQPSTSTSTAGYMPPLMPSGMYGPPLGGWHYGHGVPQERQEEMVQQQREGRERMRDRDVNGESVRN